MKRGEVFMHTNTFVRKEFKSTIFLNEITHFSFFMLKNKQTNKQTNKQNQQQRQKNKENIKKVHCYEEKNA
jgi:hypothetical protein